MVGAKVHQIHLGAFLSLFIRLLLKFWKHKLLCAKWRQ